MCLNLEKDAELKIAEEDIICYKRIVRDIKFFDSLSLKSLHDTISTNNYMTPYQRFPIEFGETYHSKLIKYGNVIEDGLHSYAKYSAALNDGFGRVATCIIPKGFEYYEGKFMREVSYASDCLKHIEIVSK